MKNILTLGLLLFMTYSLYGQNITDTIEIKKANSVSFLQDGKKLTPRSLLKITSSNTESYQEMKRAKGNYDIGSVFGFAGGFMVGLSLGSALRGNANWTPAAIGAGLLVVTIPFARSYTKHASNAVDIYNDGLKQTGTSGVESKFGVTGNGIGLITNF